MIFPTIRINIERWKWNKTFEVYVSTMGRVKNRSKELIPPKISNNGYITIFIPYLRKFVLVHRLVMLTWQPRSDAEYLTVDHIDHNKRNNSLYNLEWVSREENQRRAINDYLPNACSKDFKKKKENYSDTVIICKGKETIYKLKYSEIENEEFKVFCEKREIPISTAIKIVEDLFTGVNFQGAKKKFGLFFELKKDGK